jgi:hypothetical protein
MKINFKKTDKNVDLLKAIASKDPEVSIPAQMALAEFIGPVIQEVINNAPTLGNLYETMEFSEYDSPSIPLDLYTDVSEEDFLTVWSQAVAGGQPFNQPTPPTNELKFHTYSLDSAIAFDRKYARQGRLDVIGKTMTRMSQTVLLKQERNAAAVLLAALAGANTKLKATDNNGAYHIIRSGTEDKIVLKDFLRLFTLHKRIRSSWADGTASVDQGRGLTDLIMSPEGVELIRSLAFEPLLTGSKTDIVATDDMRNEIYESAGIPNFYGVNIIEINELGVGYKYNELFAAYAGSNAYQGFGGTGTETFDKATQELAIGVDRSGMNSLIRPVATDADNGSQFSVEPDDQFSRRSGKIGWFGGVNEGRVVTDDRKLSGLIF